MEDNVIDTKLYDLIEKATNGYFEQIKNEGKIVPPLKEKELPAGPTLRLFYNEAYYCAHSGLGLASMMLITASAELLTREVYGFLIGDAKKVEEIDWYNILDELEKEFTKRKMPQEAHAIKLVKWIREEGKRNKFHHADVKGILKNVKQPAIKLDLVTGAITKEDLDMNSPMLKKFEARYVERVSKTFQLMFLAALNDVIKILYPMLPKSL